jgi:pyruvate kinase
VQKASDIVNLRNILNTHGSQAHIVAKIETKVAILEENLEEIVKASDAVMVARGDLAVEAGAEVVPIVQRQIVALCRKHGKICIVATQMMASMVDSPEPTRAEVSDVATAVVLGADTVMLSDETANGKYPIEAVSAMKKVIVYTQNNIPVSKSTYEVVDTEKQRDAISEAAVSIANNINAEAIIAETKSGGTANNISKHRPNLPIISVTSENRTAQQLALSYANRSYVRPDSPEAGFELFKELKESGYFEDDNVTVVIVSGNQPGVVGKTDTIKVRSL